MLCSSGIAEQCILRLEPGIFIYNSRNGVTVE